VQGLGFIVVSCHLLKETDAVKALVLKEWEKGGKSFVSVKNERCQTSSLETSRLGVLLFPTFWFYVMKKVRLSAVRTGCLYPAGNIPGTHFC
jgi:hypothetical protein